MNIKATILILLLVFNTACEAKGPTKTIKVAVVDTGFGFNNRGHEAKLCRFGHKDFTADQKFYMNYNTLDPVPMDFNGHGTNIVGIIDKYTKGVDYCLVIVKIFSEGESSYQAVQASASAFDYIKNLGVDFVNYSAGGAEGNAAEEIAVKELLNSGTTIVAAAGNGSSSLDIKQNSFYPAMYDKRIVVVGNKKVDGTISETSNYGKVVNRWEVGERIEGFGIIMTGTSQATAVATGKLLNYH
jgi:Subtilase family